MTEVINSLRSLADSIEGLIRTLEAKADQQEPTLEEVRAAMAEKNKAGHREAVKAIIKKYGADKLTAIDPTHYTQVLKEVGEIK